MSRSGYGFFSFAGISTPSSPPVHPTLGGSQAQCLAPGQFLEQAAAVAAVFPLGNSDGVVRPLGLGGCLGDRLPNLTGVWVEGRKVAAIGIKVSRWITMHGFALNVCPDLRGFQNIVPCGIADKPVGSLAQFIPSLAVEEVQPRVLQAFAEVFQVTLQTGDPEALLSLMPQ